MSYSPVMPAQSRTATYPLFHSTRRKPRRWPLELRFFVKGAVHGAIVVPMALHALFAAVVVIWNRHYNGLGLSSVSNSIVGSLSIVVGLMLVFRNSTSYERFWAGRNNLTTVTTSVRNLSRYFLTNSHSHKYINGGKSSTILHQDDNNKDDQTPTPDERADTERAVRTLLAIPFAIRNHLRGEWGSALPTSPPTPIASTPIRSRSLLYPSGKGFPNNGYGSNSSSGSSYGSLGKAHVSNFFSSGNPNSNNNKSSNENYQSDSIATLRPEYVGLLPDDIRGLDDQGVGLPLLLCLMVEQYIRRCVDRGWFSTPQASQLTVQLNELTDAYGKMETIRITPVPVAHLIHQRQILALFNSILPFAIVAQLHWWTIPIVCLVTFTLYGIEGIGSQLEDPFGYDRNDIKMDAIVEDARQETMVLLEEWKGGGSVFG